MDNEMMLFLSTGEHVLGFRPRHGQTALWPVVPGWEGLCRPSRMWCASESARITYVVGRVITSRMRFLLPTEFMISLVIHVRTVWSNVVSLKGNHGNVPSTQLN